MSRVRVPDGVPLSCGTPSFGNFPSKNFIFHLLFYRLSVKIDAAVGVDYAKVPPVPIPNTEVKLGRAENTWRVTAREDRYSPTLQIPP